MLPGLYADENFPFPVIEELRRLGYDVLTMYEDETANQSLTDEQVLSIAIEGKRALLTVYRRDFIRLHRREPNHHGIIVCTFDPNFVVQAHRIAEVLRDRMTLDGQLIKINRPDR
jgi:hypothetical protein